MTKKPLVSQVSKSTEDQTKKKVFTKNGKLFSLNSSGDLRSDAHQSQIIGRDADEDHTQIIGMHSIYADADYTQIMRMQSNYWGDISSSSPPGFGTPVLGSHLTFL